LTYLHGEKIIPAMKSGQKIALLTTVMLLVFSQCKQKSANNGDAITPVSQTTAAAKWSAPDTSIIPKNETGNLIRYGRELIAHTSYYLGPKGIVSHSTNGMNCQNCHLEAGTKIFGNNYSAVASTYPKFRARSGSIETVEKRVNDCIERSLNGTPLDSNSKELRALVSYIKWVGEGVQKDSVPKGAGLYAVPLLERAANVEHGKIVFEKRCVSCHGMDGEGEKDTIINLYLYPPLWGVHSYNTGAGLFRLSRLAGYVRMNMPFDAKEEDQKLTDDEAWDVASYINSRPRPSKKFKQDWPDISKKPFDHPFGPYSDTFPEVQHKFGPFQAIVSAQKKN
jgi:thiosulfate dehydrogenase